MGSLDAALGERLDQCRTAFGVEVARPVAKAKAEGEWSLVKAADGKEMWAYEGKPLYTFAGDKKPGDMTGDGVGGVWHVAK
ncbi:hypothetical protein AOG23_18670 [Rhizobium acidisoli]|nr:hypothetical protein AOG23_18670 [Rhizobium acidisoli]